MFQNSSGNTDSANCRYTLLNVLISLYIYRRAWSARKYKRKQKTWENAKKWIQAYKALS